MALIFPTSCCMLCEQPLGCSSSHLRHLRGVFLPEDDPLFRFCDAPMHWSCYAKWPQRERFARANFALWIEHEKANPYWAKVYGDDLVFVSFKLTHVSSDQEPEFPGVSVRLAKTGTEIRVQSVEWEEWLEGGALDAAALHPLEVAAIREVLPRLRSAIPSIDQAATLVDWNAKHVLSKAQKREKYYRIQKEYNEKCREAHHRIERDGLSCPHCGIHSRDFRFVDGGEERQSYFICRNCPRSFGLHNLKE